MAVAAAAALLLLGGCTTDPPPVAVDRNQESTPASTPDTGAEDEPTRPPESKAGMRDICRRVEHAFAAIPPFDFTAADIRTFGHRMVALTRDADVAPAAREALVKLTGAALTYSTRDRPASSDVLLTALDEVTLECKLAGSHALR